MAAAAGEYSSANLYGDDDGSDVEGAKEPKKPEKPKEPKKPKKPKEPKKPKKPKAPKKPKKPKESKVAQREAMAAAAASGEYSSAKLNGDADGSNVEDAASVENGGAEVKKAKPKKPKEPKDTVAEAAAKIDVSALFYFIADITTSYESQQDILLMLLMRFADYIGCAIAAVSASQFPWTKTFKESSLDKMIDIPRSHIPEAIYKTSTDWLNQRSLDALHSFVLWSMDSLLADLASHQGTAMGSKKVVQQAPSESQILTREAGCRDDYRILPPNFPVDFDWREQGDGGMLCSVKNQEQCAMCWGIVVAEAITVGLRIRNGNETLDELSSQELLDCCEEEKEECYPHKLREAFNWVKDNGIRTEKDYPFVRKKCNCRPKTENETPVKIRGHRSVDSKDEAEILMAVRERPVCGGVDLTEEFRLLKGEIYEGSENYKRDSSGKILKHAVLIVGFGFDPIEKKNYWIIKNSYGTSWGSGGYAKIARGSSLPPGKEPLISQLCYATFD